MHFEKPEWLSSLFRVIIEVPVGRMEKRMETAVAGVLLVLAAAFALFIGNLVAEPKMLLGRSLSAIAPDLFPLIAIALMIGLCALFLISIYRRRSENTAPADAADAERADWKRIGAFFGILLIYALTFYPIGFLASTVIAMILLSLLAGNRNAVQIIGLSCLCPIGLYIVSTRLLRVSLPELSSVEFAFARVLGS